jgi:sirohydrochlorin cobaltochelatase
MEMSKKTEEGVILVGHGATAKDCPRDLVTRFKALESRRQQAGTAPSEEERQLDVQIRNWPRTSANDPYKAGLEALAEHLRPKLGGAELTVAYNEFCAPSLDEAVEQMVKSGVEKILVIPSMLTPGGVHSEVEIPEIISHLQARYPSVKFRYIWPFNLDLVAGLLAAHVKGGGVP